MTLSLQSCDLRLPDANREALSDAALQYAQAAKHKESASYADTWGDENLRADMARLTPNWTGSTLISSSATQATYLALAHVGREKVLALRVPAYFGVIRQAKQLGLTVKTWETVDDLERLGHFDAVLLTSNHTPPSGISLTDAEKTHIAALAKKQNAWVIEDNAYDPIWFKKPPTVIPSDPTKTIRIGSLSKIVSPDYRLGFIRADDEVLKQLRSHKITIELSTPPMVQIIARAGVSESMMQNLRDTFKDRVELLRAELTKKFGVGAPQPDGGPYVALPLAEGVDIHALADSCKTKGLLIDENCHQYTDNKNRAYLRLNAGAIDSAQISHAVEILHAAFKEIYIPTKGQHPQGGDQLPDRK
jgi:2-aminoadipate transaminase